MIHLVFIFHLIYFFMFKKKSLSVFFMGLAVIFFYICCRVRNRYFRYDAYCYLNWLIKTSLQTKFFVSLFVFNLHYYSKSHDPPLRPIKKEDLAPKEAVEVLNLGYLKRVNDSFQLEPLVDLTGKSFLAQTWTII